ncbi:protein ZINC INDUCED FACILITATOR-LIKE 1-like [Canna indica]|uniref:Protein ZINC INDUCED FACILITATOR-LIKE 1-like n=1 Tax=Canna indica TaxID=4628 RepID=A0AAQ3L0I2_9LILI|nr:protein ZINC INDUCED FACILITATOR-LIKE 1-like [Canna indica]
MAESREALLKQKVYFDDCPGCRQDRKKETNVGIPYKDFLYVWIVTLCTALPISSLFPYLYFMIRDLHVAKREEDIGFYAGFVGASFMAGRTLTSMFWGIVADRYGRKPVIVLSVLSVIIFNTLFGLSTSYWFAITTRLFLGLLNGISGPIKAYSAEVCRVEHQALGLSLVSTAWGIGLIIGPAIGGFFAQPAEKYPEVFSQDSFFARFPYFLPCLCISIFSFGVLIASVWLPETLHKHCKNQMVDAAIEDVETTLYSSDLKGHIRQCEENEPPKKNLFKNWPLMSSIIVYCIFSLHDMAYSEIFSLWAISDKSYGGLSFSSEEVGTVLAISGFGLLLFQITLYSPIEKHMGPVNLLRVAAVLSIPLLGAYPFMTNLSGLLLTFIVNLASLLKYILSVAIMTGLFILQNDAVSQEQRGAANGLSVTVASLFKAIAPAAGGAIFSWAQKRQYASFLPGKNLVAN